VDLPELDEDVDVAEGAVGIGVVHELLDEGIEELPFDGDHREDERDLLDPFGYDAEPSYMKQPTLEVLPKLGLKQFKGIVSKLLAAAKVAAEEGNDAVYERTMKAFRNLPGALRNAEFRAAGNSNQRKKKLGAVLKSLSTSRQLVVDIEALVGTMTNRLSGLLNRRKQQGLEKRWDDVATKTAAYARGGNLSAAMGLVLDWSDETRGSAREDKKIDRTPAQVKALLLPRLPRGDPVRDKVLSFEERCEQMLEENPDAVLPKAFQLTEAQVIASMISLPRGKAAGQSGWSNSLLKSLALDEEGNDELIPRITWWFNRIIAGNGGDMKLWTLGRVALLEKADGTPRTIAVGDTLIRCLTRTVAFAKKLEAEVILKPHQFSVGVAGGVEQVSQAFALLQKRVKESGGDRCISPTDGMWRTLNLQLTHVAHVQTRYGEICLISIHCL
jgi:hypothetical protein